MRVLLVEDDVKIAAFVENGLREAGFGVDCTGDGEQALHLALSVAYDAAVVDIMLPRLDGLSLISTLRHRGIDTPILVLSARQTVDDRIAGLQRGADDYLVKPFDFRELSARCRVLARRRSGSASNDFRAGNFTFDRGAKRALVDGRDLELRAREIQLLEVFLGNLGRVLTKEELADKIYTFDEAHSLNAVEQAVTRLRRRTQGTPFIVKTARGLGYIADVVEE